MGDAVDLVRALAWPAIVAVGVWYFRASIRDVLRRTTAFEAFGVSMKFAEKSLDDAAEDRRNVTPAGLERAHARLRADGHLLAGSRILWVDDDPTGNFNERRLFERLGASVDPALTTDEGLDLVRRNPYDVIITDWKRGTDANAGPNFVNRLPASVRTPVVYYVIHTEGRDRGRAFAMTNRPDQLVIDVLDAIHRGAH